ncbi:hypothetical protein MMG85_03985 [Pseudoxanthomonas sp. LH2527]|uniref:hypothetical protein n=1 Tax=Pseudoxanthomonas sp. LH2527 TaxID=2923249 RepID=UPI001F13BBEB|nr:hypothetical protein [Pseudoxanthomonas sp. LH2527]MCH6482732.1 hypothetical protein [Pseudoxanthomonas sp. LH2527]
MGGAVAKLLVGAGLFTAIAVAFVLLLGGTPPAVVYLLCGCAFALCFKIAGEPLRLLLLTGRSRVVASYLISMFGMVVSIYVLWLAFRFTAPDAGT